MHNLQSPEKICDIADQALNRIKEESLLPTPETFELWYVHYSGGDPEVSHAIEILEKSGQPLTDERCEELHQRFLSDTAENERVKEAGDQIQETIQSVGGIVNSVKSATADYNIALGKVTEELSGDDIDIKDARAALDNMVSTTRTMMDENTRLEQELSKSTEVMQELKRDLEMVRKQALTDGLTNISNRKSFNDEIVRILDDAETQGLTFCLIMLDIDHFKSFNDTYGHQVGDQVLRLVAKTLFDGVKGRDMVARYGGEEFAVILPETTVMGATKLADALRVAVAGKEVINRNSGEKLGRITMSGGVAEYVPGESVEDIIDRADAALYTAKHNGRNQISKASDAKRGDA